MTYQFSARPYIVFGRDARMQVGDYLLRLGAQGRVLLVCGKHLVRSGTADQLSEVMGRAGLETVVFSDCVSDCPAEVIRQGVACAKEAGVGAVVAAGGGSVLDAGKAIAIMLDHEGDILDYCGARDMFRRTRTRPFIAIPTTCGTGSEVTDGGVVFDTKARLKVSYWDWRAAADVALVDVGMLDGMPRHLMAATAMDAMSHAVEAFTGRQHNPVSDAAALGAISGLAQNLLLAYRTGSEEAIENVLISSTMAGMAFNRSGVHIGHAIAHALGAVSHVHHGTACAIALPFVVSSQAGAMPERMHQLAMTLGLDPEREEPSRTAGQAVAQWLMQMNRKLGIGRLTQYGVDETSLEQVLRLTMEDHHLGLAVEPITREQLQAYLYEML